MAVLQDTQKAPIQLAVTDAAGEAIAGVAIDTTTDGALGAEGNPVVTIDLADPLNPVAVANDVGTSTVTSHATGTNPDGTPIDLTATIDIEVVASDATTLTMTLGTPVAK